MYQIYVHVQETRTVNDGKVSSSSKTGVKNAFDQHAQATETWKEKDT